MAVLQRATSKTSARSTSYDPASYRGHVAAVAEALCGARARRSEMAQTSSPLPVRQSSSPDRHRACPADSA